MSNENSCTVHDTKNFDTTRRANIFLTEAEAQVLDTLRATFENEIPPVSLMLLQIVNRFEHAVLTQMGNSYREAQ